MSKSLNLLAPAVGGTALVLGIAYGVATRQYRAADAEMALAQAQQAQIRAEAAEQRIAEQSSAAAEQAEALAAAQERAEAAEVAAEARRAEIAKLREAAASGGSVVAEVASAAVEPPEGGYSIGRPATEEEVAAWDVDVRPDGTGLPPGSGSVEDGEVLFSDNCASCHGEFAEGSGNWPKLAGGDGTLADDDPLKTVGSYWPYLSTAWDYVHRSMPFGDAQSLTDDETYAIVAYILYSNYLVEEDFVLSNENFLDIEMPNADGFIVDDRAETEYPKWRAEPCMENCKDDVEITMRATVLDVTPDEGNDEADSAQVEEQPSVVEAADEPVAEAVEADAGEVAETEESAPAEAALDPELVAAGETVFRKCKSCHQVGDSAKNRTGPVLNGIVGAPVAAVDGFRYSNVFKQAHDDGMVWDEANLAAFLANPKAEMKGTKMSFNGLKSEEDVQAVIEYLKSFDG